MPSKEKLFLKKFMHEISREIKVWHHFQFLKRNIYSVKQTQIMGSTFWYFSLFLSIEEIRTLKSNANERRSILQ